MTWLELHPCLFCVDSPDDGDTFDKKENRFKFSQALLLAGVYWSKRRHETSHGMSLRGALSDNARSMPWHISFARGEKLYKNYLKKRHPDINALFYQNSGIDLDGYYDAMRILSFMYLYVTPENLYEGAGMLNVNNGLDAIIEPTRSIIKKVIDFESQTPQQFKEWFSKLNPNMEPDNYDDTPIRQRPILKTQDGRIVILDPVLFTTRATMGAYYALLNILPKSDPRVGALSAAFGKAFEQYSADLLNKSKSVHCRHLRDPRAEDNANQRPQLSDYCIVNDNKIFFIEAKAAKEPGECIINNPERYRKYLRDHYSENSDKPKGTAQIARSINNLLNGTWEAVDSQLSRLIARKKEIIIYPILLIHDDLVSLDEHVRMLCEDFEKYLLPEQYFPLDMSMKKYKCRIQRLAVLTITDLENLVLLSDNHTISALISDFVKWRGGRNGRLLDFLSQSSEYSHRISQYYFSPTGMKEGFNEIDRLGIKLFGKPIRTDKEAKVPLAPDR